ncbi:SRPBCC family protein [Spongisporangium articulatum]|uniref:SRPBCC family protein n=1 Tax=Spongisporangium articulatum TaxID=3362603 RepID=A0ABW8AKT8_9ACTN
MTVSDSVVVAADALTLWRAVADPTQMPRWSPENTGAVLESRPQESRPLTVGETFVGSNRRRAWTVVVARWRTHCVVTISEPGECFEFRVDRFGLRKPSLGVNIATWRYTFRAVPGGTRVTETWVDGRQRWPNWAARGFDFFAVTGRTFAAYQRRNIARTLGNLQADFAQSAT